MDSNINSNISSLVPNMILSLIMSMLSVMIFCILLSHSALAEEMSLDLETYIVHVNLPEGQDQLESWYHSFLPTTEESGGSSRMVHSYRNVFTGFAAKLSPEEVKEMENKEGFVTAWPQKNFALHTTHSPNFLGLNQNSGVWPDSNYGEGVIIGVLDSGITPGHPSFSDEDMPPPPKKWKGKCDFNFNGSSTWSCNNKVIGARNLVSYFPGPPVDEVGHGTHTSSTAGGKFIRGANIFGMANGTASGMAPRAHLAIYKVCSAFGCFDADILAGMDVAVEDGVDILSISLGGGQGVKFFEDGVAIGAFGAMQKGVFVSCSAGNSGPHNGSLSNDAPWILTVGASTIDREIVATVVLGNLDRYEGESLFQPRDFPSDMFFPLVDARREGGNETAAALCGPGSLDKVDVKGKVVLCERGGDIAQIDKGKTVLDAGGIAVIIMNDQPNGYCTLAEPHVITASHVSYDAGLKIRSYINSTSTPLATIVFRGTVIGDPVAPMVSSFSSRGPSLASPGILKPDIVGPGVNILAAWHVSIDNYTSTKSDFNIISGTSMSCPHLSGIAALLKRSHPNWSPALIKSAIMTTANEVNLGGNPIEDQRLIPADIFAIGAGHVNPTKANDPGLVYDIHPDDYTPYLCGLNYTNRQVGMFLQRRVNCSEESRIREAQLNYPSFSIILGSTPQSYTRLVTNVGEFDSSYDVEIVSPAGVTVSVYPTSLSFSEVNQKLIYNVTFTRFGNGVTSAFGQGYISWNSMRRSVRSPVVIVFE